MRRGRDVIQQIASESKGSRSRPSLAVDWEDIKDSIDFGDVVNGLGVSLLEQKGHEHSAHCPLPSHPGADRSPSFWVNDRKLVYNCFVCGGGDLPSLVQEVEGLDYEAAIDWLIPFSEYEADDDMAFVEQIVKTLNKRPEPRKPRHPVVPWFPMKAIDRYLDNEPKGEALQWLQERYIDEATRRRFKIVYDPMHHRPGHDWIGPAMLLAHIFKGQLVGYQERWFNDGERPKSLHKYMASSDFPKKDTLYNYDTALKLPRDHPLFVVESPATVARLGAAGYVGVALFGASINPTQEKLLRGFERLVLAPDNDVAGEKFTRKFVRAMHPYCDIEMIPAPDGDKADLAELDDDQLNAQLALAKPPFDLFPHT